MRPNPGEETAGPDQIEKITIASLHIVIFFSLVAMAFEYVFLRSSYGASDFEIASIALTTIGLSLIWAMIFITGPKYMNVLCLLACIGGVAHLLFGFGYILYVSSHPETASHFGYWFLVPFILAISTQPPKISQLFCWISVALVTLISAGHIVRTGVPVIEDPIAASLVQLVIAQVVSVSLLVILSAYRERHWASRARIEALKESADILERTAREAEVARRDAEAANETRARFLANMSHELRTPLNAIIGFSDILGREMFGPHGDRRYAEYAKDINNSGNHLLGIINQILDFSKIDSGYLELDIKALKVSDAISDAVRLMALNASDADVDLRVRESGSDIWVCADDRAMRQILLNLVSNAIKFTQPGGTVTVTAGDGLGGRVFIEVRDTGVGIAKQHINSVLEPFTRLDNPMTATVQGTGLGLPIVRSLVEALGGSIELKSVVGEGTTVTVHLLRSPSADELGEPRVGFAS
ncbi:MAG: HAMP domain-containing histidine kinase [Minwuiales bacterium]|nr:HAMP domain-containing histidine kinase [Minwuiales bacterium]